MPNFEKHFNNFLEVRDILKLNHMNLAVARAFKKPFKWYGQHSIQDAVDILIAESYDGNYMNILE